jgi:sugar lactone lactonase YvrE
VSADHRIWVVDTVQAEVQVFDADGRHEQTFGSKGSGDGELDRPVSPFVDVSSGEVYIPDFANRRVSVFGTDGTWLRHYDRALNPELTFDELNAVVVDRAGRLFAVDTTNRLFVVARDGTLEAIFSDILPEAGRIEYSPFQIDGDGRMYVADIGGTMAGRLITGQLGPPLWPPPGEGG